MALIDIKWCLLSPVAGNDDTGQLEKVQIGVNRTFFESESSIFPCEYET